MYDYHISDNLGECADFGRKLGWKGLCYVIPSEDFEKDKNSIKKLKTKLDVALGVLIEGETMNQVKRLIDKYHNKAELVFVRGGDAELNRYIFNMPSVDVVTNVSNESRLDYVMCRLAAKHGIAIEFDFLELLQSYSKTRSRLLANLIKNAALVRKFIVPFIVTSGAISKWDMRSPHDLMVFGKILGFQDPELKDALSSKILEENRKRISGKKIMQGIEEI